MKPKWLNNKKVMICLAVCAAAAAVLLFLLFQNVITGKTPGAAQIPQSGAQSEMPAASALPSFRLSVWVAYWDWENGMNELNALSGMPDSAEAFAASFDSSDKLFYPEGMPDMDAKLKTLQTANPGLPVYLSIVNDTVDAGGNWTDKNSGLIDRLMQSNDSRAKHADDILALAEQGGFDGVEIDYEKISSQSWQGFCDFCARLNTVLQQKGEKLRVVLEPHAPISKAQLPAGPDYVVMAYNLFGAGTGPGPKADEAFIRKLAAEMGTLQGSKTLAFATGGYDWAPGGSAREVTETEAYNLSRQSHDVQRDNASGDLHFTYQKDDGTHTVWYADSQTLKTWFSLSRSLGISDVALWKLGESRPDTLQMLGQLKKNQ